MNEILWFLRFTFFLVAATVSCLHQHFAFGLKHWQQPNMISTIPKRNYTATNDNQAKTKKCCIFRKVTAYKIHLIRIQTEHIFKRFKSMRQLNQVNKWNLNKRTCCSVRFMASHSFQLRSYCRWIKIKPLKNSQTFYCYYIIKHRLQF